MATTSLSSNLNKAYTLLILIFLITTEPDHLCSQSFVPGATYFDATGYVEYLSGNLPIVISTPHGGYLEPSQIPDRNCSGCVYVRDSYTQELAREIYASIIDATDCYPHIVINLLHRKKFDANRAIDEAADGNSTVEESWVGYHAFIDSAKAEVMRNYGRGLFLDLHGHGHDIQRIELGYTLSRSELELPDSELNSDTYIEQSSIQTLVGDNLLSLTHAELLRGNLSFGSLLDDQGYPSIPSTDDQYPFDGDPYFSGGYNTRRHGSLDGGAIDGIQVECNQTIRFNESLRQTFADSIAQTIIAFLDYHYHDQFEENACGLISSTSQIEKLPNTTIYPNPTDGFFQVVSSFDSLDLSIYNGLGQLIISKTWNGAPIDVSSLQKGLYFVTLTSSQNLHHSTVLIKQ